MTMYRNMLVYCVWDTILITDKINMWYIVDHEFQQSYFNYDITILGDWPLLLKWEE